jgi:hypothetical protein
MKGNMRNKLLVIASIFGAAFVSAAATQPTKPKKPKKFEPQPTLPSPTLPLPPIQPIETLPAPLPAVPVTTGTIVYMRTITIPSHVRDSVYEHVRADTVIVVSRTNFMRCTDYRNGDVLQAFGNLSYECRLVSHPRNNERSVSGMVLTNPLLVPITLEVTGVSTRPFATTAPLNSRIRTRRP